MNVASRMESNGSPGAVRCSAACWEEMLRCGYAPSGLEVHGEVEVKGKGPMDTVLIAVDETISCAAL